MINLFGQQIDTLDSEKIFDCLSNGQFSSLTDMELVYSIVGSEELAAKVYGTAHKDLSYLFKYSVNELIKLPGMGKKKAIALVAALEMGRRRNLNVKNVNKLVCSKDVFEEMKPKMIDLKHEEVWIILVNNSSHIIGEYQMFKGGRTSSVVDISMIMRKAIENSATGLFLIHNHPSANEKPSFADDKTTNSIKSACEIMQIRLLDHIIIADNLFYSYADNGKL